jgi:hypothetical protein
VTMAVRISEATGMFGLMLDIALQFYSHGWVNASGVTEGGQARKVDRRQTFLAPELENVPAFSS